ncbi:ATP-binding cassette domain-containing protein [Labrys sp. 22185]|uniref:ATP-binding cassette domain-containing protein n=1 Tax=Labrys sp. 22185 TaxID=3453888 RepID=UPI003F8614D8
MNVRSMRMAFWYYLNILSKDRIRFLRVNSIQAVIALCNLAFPVVLALLVAVLSRVVDGATSTQGLPNFLVSQINKFEPREAAIMFLGGLFVIEVVRNFLQLTLQTELDAQAIGVYKTISLAALKSYLEQGYLSRIRHSSHQLQGILTQLLFAAKGLQTGLVGRVIPITIEAIIALIVVVWLFGLPYLLMFGGLLATFVCFSFFFSKKTDRAQKDFQSSFGRAAAAQGDALALHDQIVSFGGTRRALADVSEDIQLLHDTQLRALYSQRRFSSTQSLTVYAFAYAMLGLLVAQIFSGTANVAALILLTTYIFQFTAPLNTIGFFIRDSVRHLTVIDEVLVRFMAVDQVTRPQATSRQLTRSTSEPSVHCGNIVYRSKDGLFSLSIEQLDVRGAKDVAVVGPNGSGKSTFARLLAGHISAQDGEILINGASLVGAGDLSSIARYVPQSGQLFRKSGLYNLTFPLTADSVNRNILRDILIDLDAKDELIDKILRDDEVASQLSGGEVQKILLARAILNPAPIMILDESTSDLDVISSSRVRDVFRRRCSNSLILYITHSESFAQSCDEIIEFEDGRLSQHRQVKRHSHLLKR